MPEKFSKILETKKTAADALNSMAQEGLFDFRGILAPWLRHIINVVIRSKDPNNLAASLIQFSQYLEDKRINYEADESIWLVESVIYALAAYPEPLPRVQSLILIGQKLGFSNNIVHNGMFETVLKHPAPKLILQALSMMGPTDILNNRSTRENLQQLMNRVNLWFGNSEIARRLEAIPARQFKQHHFDGLLTISRTLSSNGYNLKEVQRQLQKALSDIHDEIETTVNKVKRRGVTFWDNNIASNDSQKTTLSSAFNPGNKCFGA